MASVTRCPFRCLAGARGQEPGAPSGRPECPFKSLLRTSSSEWVVPSKSDHDPVQEAPVQTAASDSKPQATKCPLGFVAGSEPSMDVLNCSVCGALLHEAVELDCAHRACMYCATRATCCGACGKKSESVRSDPTMQGNTPTHPGLSYMQTCVVYPRVCYWVFLPRHCYMCFDKRPHSCGTGAHCVSMIRCPLCSLLNSATFW